MAEPRRAATSTILIIDDTPANLAVMVDQLEEVGYRVSVAQEGEEGLQRAEYIRPDLILLDVMMPGIDGFETCRRLKNNDITQDIPVIFMTALTDTADKVEGFSVGAVDYVSKPLQIEEVLARVNTHLTLRAMQQLLEAKNIQLNHQIEEREQKEAQLQHRATHDMLTELPNRLLFNDRLEHAISKAVRDETRLAVMFIDLDKFKDINDAYGHDAGDELLQETAGRLAQCVRKSDTVARLGGDEFICLIENFGERRQLVELAERIERSLFRPVVLSDKSHNVSCSIGISVCPDDGDDAGLLLRQADIAMYQAKKTGKPAFQFFNREMQTHLTRRVALEKQLRGAVERDEFVLHYQPQVDLVSGRIIALEALIRWDSPKMGLLSPDAFIPVAEKSKLIQAIGEWVVNAACEQIGAWRGSAAAGIPIAINLASTQITSGFVDALMEIVRRHGIETKSMEFELTETMSMTDPETTIALMNRMKERGVSLAIDDFGTGYSNLSYLRRFPVDKLKIDKLFTGGLIDSPEDRSIVSSVIRLTHSLGMRAVAEGVENEGQLRYLVQEGCDAIQGYHFCRPLPAAEIADFLQSKPDLAAISEQPYRRRALLVDDDEAVFASFRPLADVSGFELITASDAGSAYEILACQDVGVVICDVRLPGESGITLLESVRKMYPRIIRIMITGYGSYKNLEEGINRAHAHKYVAKPWDPDDVMGVLNESFRLYEG